MLLHDPRMSIRDQGSTLHYHTVPTHVPIRVLFSQHKLCKSMHPVQIHLPVQIHIPSTNPCTYALRVQCSMGDHLTLEGRIQIQPCSRPMVQLSIIWSIELAGTTHVQ